MNKVTAFLEKYVQWVALGLGVAWIGLMAWMFWTSPKAQITVDGTVYAPGALDDAMVKNEGPVKTLERSIAKDAPQVVKVDPKKNPTTHPSFVNEYLAQLTGPPADFNAPITIAVHAGDFNVGPTGPNAPDAVKGTLVKLDGSTMLIPLPGVDGAGKAINAVVGRSIVQIPDKAQLVDPMAPLAAPGPDGAPAPAVVAAPAAPAVAVPPTEVEINWITASFTVKMDVLAKAFDAAKTPAGLPGTLFLAVDVIREEQEPGGQWVKPTPVKPLANHIIPPLPTDKLGQLRFEDWATKSQTEIVHPPFYVWVAGAQWRSASMPVPLDAGAPPVADAGQAFDPANPPTDRPLTTEEKGKVFQYQQKLKQEAAKQKALENKNKLPAPLNPGGGGGRPGGMALMPETEAIGSSQPPILLAQVSPHQSPGYGDRPASTHRPTGPAPVTPPPLLGERPFAPPAAPGAPAQAVPVVEGFFNPATTPDTEIYFHDDTVEAGKTYRYKVRVHLLNPLFDTKNMAVNQKDADVFDLVMENMTGPIAVPPKYYFFLASGPNILPGKANVKVDYYYWTKGFWQAKTMVVQPGDAIGETDWTVADLRKDPRGDQHDHVLFVNGQGALVAHTLGTDLKDPDNSRMKQQARAGGQPAASAAEVGR